MSGRAEKFKEDIDAYLRFRHDCDAVEQAADDIDFEEFMGFLDVEFYLNVRGSQTWSDDGNETQVLVKTLIGQILSEQTPRPAEVPDLYLRFAHGLQPNDTIVTFNYDTLMERSLTRVGKPFRLFPSRYREVGIGTAEVDDSVEEIRLYKVHGSIDWFDRSRYKDLEDRCTSRGLGKPYHAVFNRPDIRLAPLVDGPRLPDDPMQEMHRVINIETLYSSIRPFEAAPWLLNPSAMKLLFAARVKDFWGYIARDGLANLGIVIIGYSLPPHDEYARQMLYRLITNYQSAHWQKESGFDKAALVLIDFRESEAAREDLRSRYRFVDWSRTHCYFSGFNEEVLPALFSQSK